MAEQTESKLPAIGCAWALLSLALLCPTATAGEAGITQQVQQSRSTYMTAEAWAARRGELRTEFLKGAGLWPLPPRPPAVAMVHNRRVHGEYSVENIALETFPGFYCSGNLYRPVGRKGLSPVVLCPDGQSGPPGRFCSDLQICAAHLARMGATVLSYGMVDRQHSRQTAPDDPRAFAWQLWNGIRALDYVTSLPRIDAQRIGVMGVSGGGPPTVLLTLVDDRIKVSAPIVTADSWVAPDGGLGKGGLAVMRAARASAMELAAAAAPRPQLLIAAGKSDRAREFSLVGVPFVQHMYALAGGAKKLLAVPLADEDRDLGATKRRLVYSFFATHLSMEPDAFLALEKTQSASLLSEDLTKVTIETPQQLEVFHDAHPLPPHALSGSGLVAAAFERHVQELRQGSATRESPIRVEKADRAAYSFEPADVDDEAVLFTPAGFQKVGWPKVAAGAEKGLLDIAVRNAGDDQPTPCRINVVGPDGDYYEPAGGMLKQHSLTGVWPQSGWGNRQGKAPIRYLGRFFYSTGTDTVEVPAGVVRVEVWKGLEYRPASVTTHVPAGGRRRVEVVLEHSAAMIPQQYWSGDPHIHIERRNSEDERRILDLLAAEDIHFGTLLAYNEPANRYAAFLNALEAPQLRGLGRRSLLYRDGYAILSGQEYRSSHYGHLNLYLLDELVAPGQSYNADEWPPFGHVAAAARAAGGVAVHAHGGYGQEVYADVVHGNIDAVELLQFGVYRGIGLDDWYHLLNVGFRVPATGACDYPACRKLGDCTTYVWSEADPDMEGWLRGMARGQSFFTSGPLLLLEVDGKRPGTQLTRSGSGPHRVTARVRVRCEVAPVTHVQLIANGRVARQMEVSRSAGQGQWLELEGAIELSKSAWIAARAYSLSPRGRPDAESHTNPVYVCLDGRAPYEGSSLAPLVMAIDKQIAIHKKRKFAEQAKVVAYFEQARDALVNIRATGGLAAPGVR